MLLFLAACGQKKEAKEAITSIKAEFENPEGVTFKVDDVELAKTLLKTDSARFVFESKIGKEIRYFPEEQTNYCLVNCSNNGLIQTIQECYDNHRPLVLTPDVIWLAICQGVSIHINEQYDSLKGVIFKANKPNEILIRNDELDKSDKNWEKLIASFANETKKYTRDDFYSFFVSEFTTTTPIIKTAYQVTLLESYKKAFEYIGESGCGIPSICLTGTKADWISIFNKLDMLDEICLSNWAKNLKPIISEFISASEGNYDKKFWQNIYKNATEYNAFYISGWIIKFFPYIKERDTDRVYIKELDKMRFGELYIPNKFLDGDDYLLSTLSTDNFPTGIAKVPFTWNNYYKNTTQKMEVYAGFFAIKQYPDKSLEPFVSWAVCDKNATNVHHSLAANESLNLKHQPDYWSPNFAWSLTDSAIYDIKRFKSQSISLAYVKSLILDSLKQNSSFTSAEYSNDTIQIEILSNGRPAGVTMYRSKNQQLSDYIKGLVKGLPEQWFPALAHPADVLDLGDGISEEENKIKVRANSIVKIGL